MLMLFAWVVPIVVAVRKKSNQTTRRACVMVAYDSLTKDIRSAPAYYNQWLHITEQEIIWRGVSSDVGWCVQQEKLFRLEGRYNAEKKTWEKKSKNLIVNHEKQIHFRVITLDDMVKGVAFGIGDATYYVAIRNGIVP